MQGTYHYISDCGRLGGQLAASQRWLRRLYELLTTVLVTETVFVAAISVLVAVCVCVTLAGVTVEVEVLFHQPIVLRVVSYIVPRNSRNLEEAATERCGRGIHLHSRDDIVDHKAVVQ